MKISNYLDDFVTDVQCEEYYRDEPYYYYDDESDDNIIPYKDFHFTSDEYYYDKEY